MYWMTGISGFVLMIAPFTLGYSQNAPALWISVVVGLATIILSCMEGAQHETKRWEYWTIAILGIIAIVAPFVMDFGYLTSALVTSIVTGMLISLFAGAKLSMGVGHKTRHVSW